MSPRTKASNHDEQDAALMSALGRVVGEWGNPIVRCLGAAHVWVLLVIVDILSRSGQRISSISARTLERYSGMSRAHIWDLLGDLEATGCIVRHERRRGRPTRLEVVLDWCPTPEALARGGRSKQDRNARKQKNAHAEKPGGVRDNPSTLADAPEQRPISHGWQAAVSHGRHPDSPDLPAVAVSFPVSPPITGPFEGGPDPRPLEGDPPYLSSSSSVVLPDPPSPEGDTSPLAASSALRRGVADDPLRPSMEDEDRSGRSIEPDSPSLSREGESRSERPHRTDRLTR